MELSSHVVSNLDQWVEDGFITADQRESIAQLMEAAVQDAYEYGLSHTEDRSDAYQEGLDDGYDNGYDDGYDNGYDNGYRTAKEDLTNSMRDEWFEQGWAEALIEHGIEE
jgi:flagellar biosynthesis/type III secretory pathway protein FliH